MSTFDPVLLFFLLGLAAGLLRSELRLPAAVYELVSMLLLLSIGLKGGAWGENSNIRVEVVCDAATAEAIASHLQVRYYDNYAMILFVSDVAVLRPGKF